MTKLTSPLPSLAEQNATELLRVGMRAAPQLLAMPNADGTTAMHNAGYTQWAASTPNADRCCLPELLVRSRGNLCMQVLSSQSRRLGQPRCHELLQCVLHQQYVMQCVQVAFSIPTGMRSSQQRMGTAPPAGSPWSFSPLQKLKT